MKEPDSNPGETGAQPRAGQVALGLSIRCIAFDAVGTLIYPEPAVAQVYHAVAAAHGSRLTRDEIRSRFHTAFRATEQNDLQGVPHEGAARFITSEPRERQRWREIVDRVCDDVRDRDACFVELYEHFARPASWRCFDDVEPVLAELHARGYRLLLASNFDQRLQPVAAGLPPLRFIADSVISATVGFRKPSHAFFAALCNRAACRPDEVLMVGDDFENDVQGARACGLPALLLNRSPTAPPGALASLHDLLSPSL